MSIVHDFAQAAGLAALGAGCLYELLALTAVLWWKSRASQAGGTASAEPISVLKPLCGAEPGLYAQLRSFCDQDYPAYEVVFGIRDPADPARLTVERLAAEFPHVRMTLVSDPQLHGSNLKVSNLINMLRRARHAILVISDSDAQVGRDYLARVSALLQPPRVGLVTSLYRAIPGTGLWSRIGAMYINDWYMPSVLLARMFGHRGYVSGQTMCMRRRTLEDSGGFEALTDHLAEDHRFGELVQSLGLEIVISPYPVTCTQHEPTFRSLFQHELRWLRTLRILAPCGFAALFPTFCLPLCLAGLLLVWLATPAPWAWAAAIGLSGTIVGARLAVHCLQRPGGLRRQLATVWLVPVRDLLLAWEWVQAFASRRVVWRGREFIVDRGGLMHRLPDDEASQQGPASRTEQLLN